MIVFPERFPIIPDILFDECRLTVTTLTGIARDALAPINSTSRTGSIGPRWKR